MKKNHIIGFILASLSTLFLSIGQILYKEGAMNFVFNLHMILTNYHLLIGLFIHFISFILFISSLKFGSLSYIYPVMASGYLWVNILAVIFLREVVSHIEWVGIFLIIIGISFVTLGDKNE